MNEEKVRRVLDYVYHTARGAILGGPTDYSKYYLSTLQNIEAEIETLTDDDLGTTPPHDSFVGNEDPPGGYWQEMKERDEETPPPNASVLNAKGQVVERIHVDPDSVPEGSRGYNVYTGRNPTLRQRILLDKDA